MTEYKIECRYNRSDVIAAHAACGEIWFEPGSNNVSPSLADARTFARGILALADEVDGGEAEPATEPASDVAPQMPAVGDRVRVLTNRADGASVSASDVLTVKSLSTSDFLTEEGWYLRPESVEILPADESTTVGITTPTREAYLHRAADLLGANPSAHDLIELADYLAEEGA